MNVKIGDLGQGGAGLSEGHKDGDDGSLREIILALKAQLDALYAKLNADAGVTDTDYDQIQNLEE